MVRNPSRSTLKATAASTQQDVDAYKARSMWGAWRGLKHEVRDRYFNADEIAWITRYGSRLDQIACMVAVPRNEREKHFLGVCSRHYGPINDRERLWLRAQMVVRFEGALERSARCDQAEELAAGLAARCQQLAADLKDAEEVGAEFLPQIWMMQGETAVAKDQADRAARRLTLRNVERVPDWVFARRSRDVIHLLAMTEATRGPGVILR